MHFFCLLKASVHSLKGQCMHAESLQLCPTLCDPMDCSPSGSSVHGVLQAHALLQGIFLTHGSNLCFLYPLHWQAVFFFYH